MEAVFSRWATEARRRSLDVLTAKFEQIPERRWFKGQTGSSRLLANSDLVQLGVGDLTVLQFDWAVAVRR